MNKPTTDAAIAHKLREALDAAQCQARILRQRGYSVDIQVRTGDGGEPELAADITKVEHVRL